MISHYHIVSSNSTPMQFRVVHIPIFGMLQPRPRTCSVQDQHIPGHQCPARALSRLSHLVISPAAGLEESSIVMHPSDLLDEFDHGSYKGNQLKNRSSRYTVFNGIYNGCSVARFNCQRVIAEKKHKGYADMHDG